MLPTPPNIPSKAPPPPPPPPPNLPPLLDTVDGESPFAETPLEVCGPRSMLDSLEEMMGREENRPSCPCPCPCGSDICPRCRRRFRNPGEKGGMEEPGLELPLPPPPRAIDGDSCRSDCWGADCPGPTDRHTYILQ